MRSYTLNTCEEMKITTVMVAIVTISDFWRIDLAPHPENIAVHVVTECRTGEPFFALNRVDITGRTTVVTVQRPNIPEQSRDCWVGVQVLRNAADDPTKDYVGEYTVAKVE